MIGANAPTVAGLPAVFCDKLDCHLCRGVFADCFCEWLCPHCKRHLSRDNRVCMSLCGLKTANGHSPSLYEFQGRAAEADRQETP